MNYTVLPSGYRRIGGVDLLQDRRSMLIVNLGRHCDRTAAASFGAAAAPVSFFHPLDAIPFSFGSFSYWAALCSISSFMS